MLFVALVGFLQLPHNSCRVSATQCAFQLAQALYACMSPPVAGSQSYGKDLNVLAEQDMLLHKAALQMWQQYGLLSGREALLC
jgi:hypothetical protein